MVNQTITLNDGNKVPQLGFGTWQSKPGEVGQAVKDAIASGYRHLDFAKVYQNQKEIAPSLKGVPREELFLTSKLWNSAHKPEHVAAAYEDTLKELGVDYLDLYLIHWPVPFESPEPINNLFPQEDGKVILDSKTTLVDTWKALVELQKAGKVKSIGVSNFTPAAIEAIHKATGVWPAVNQIERHPLLLQPELVAWHKEKNINITAYSPLAGVYEGKKPLVQYDQVKQVAQKVGATPAQVLIAWGLIGGHTVIPKSVTHERIVSNFKSTEIKLDDEDVKTLEALGAGDGYLRLNTPFNYKPQWDINVFGEPEEAKATADVNFGI